MNWLQGTAPVIAIWGIGLSIMFNGINWIRDKQKQTHKFGQIVFGFGLVIVIAGVFALGNCCEILIALSVFILVVGLGWRFVLKDP
jgi:uncharacterized membrane protein YcjF (UPF0283 family)